MSGARGRPPRPRQPAILAVIALTLAALAWPSAAAAQAPPADRLRVLFLGDNGHHQPAERAKTVLPVLAQRGVDLFYTDDPADLNPARLDDYHALVLYHNHEAIAPAQLHALLRFVERGGGLIAVHCASASFQNAEAYVKLIGGAFRSHGVGPVRTVRPAPDHPALRGVPEFESWDETYVHTRHNPVGRTVLEIRPGDAEDEPWTWVRTYGAGRVFYTAWGHDLRTWGHEGFQALLLQGVRWAAGDWAIDRLPAEPRPAMVDLEVPLPRYEPYPAPWNTLGEPVRQAPGPLPPEASLVLTTLPPGFRAEPFAAEPAIGRIVDFTWDEAGRMWAVETNDYPNRVLPEEEPGGDRILVLEDTNGDGRADRVTVFADGMNLATSLVLANGGVIVAQAPDMLFFRDTTGDGRADVREVLFTGWPRHDTHGTPSNLRYGFDNRILGSVGYNGFTGTVGGRTWERGEFAQGYFRFPADGSSLEYLARTSNNTWGVALSEDHHIFGSTANGRPSNFVHIPARYYHALGMREPTLPGIEDRADIYPLIDILQVDHFGRYTAGAAHELYTARAFPREYWNRIAFVADPTGHLVGMFELSPEGSAFRAKNRWSFLASRDAWSAPVQVKVGPDGALWVSDFYTLVSQHNPTPDGLNGCCEMGDGQAYETPNRDAYHSRIYRIAWRDAPAYEPVRLDQAEPAQLVEALGHDNLFWRLTAQRLLVERGNADVVPALVRLANDHTVDELGLNPGALHALWTLDGLGALAQDGDAREAARAALHHPAAALRRAALMVLPREPGLADDILDAGLLPGSRAAGGRGYTVPGGLRQDADARVRLEALLALSELPASPRAASAVAEALFVPRNAADRWLPDAAGIAGARQGVPFLLDVLQRRLPEGDAATAGIARAVSLMAHHHARTADAAAVFTLVHLVPGLHEAVASGVLAGLAGGWPEDQPPAVSPEERTALAAAARAAPRGLGEQFERLEERWGLDIWPTSARYVRAEPAAAAHDHGGEPDERAEAALAEWAAQGSPDGADVLDRPDAGPPDRTITLRTRGANLDFEPNIISARAGTRLRVVYVNEGTLPHNFVVLRDSNDLDLVGLAAYEAGPTGFVPLAHADRLIAWTRLASAGQTVEVTFVVPPPGDYTFVCLVPGHYMVMLGRLRSLP